VRAGGEPRVGLDSPPPAVYVAPTAMLLRPTFTFIPPALPSPGERPPRGTTGRTAIRRPSRPVNRLKLRSCLIDGEAVCCDERGLAMFHALRRRRNDC
jgi:hypothetical protein